MTEQERIEEAFEGVLMTERCLESAFGRKYGIGRYSLDRIGENVSALRFPEHRDHEAESAARELLPVTALQTALDVFLAHWALDKSSQGALDAGLCLIDCAKYFYQQGEW